MGGRSLVVDGRELLREGRYDEALMLFEQALLEDENDPDAWNCKGAALRSMGRYDEANKCFNRSLRIDPRDRHSS